MTPQGLAVPQQQDDPYAHLTGGKRAPVAAAAPRVAAAAPAEVDPYADLTTAPLPLAKTGNVDPRPPAPPPRLAPVVVSTPEAPRPPIAPPRMAPRDALRTPVDRAKDQRHDLPLTGVAKTANDAFYSMADNPVTTATALPMAPIKSAFTAGRYVGQKAFSTDPSADADASRSLGIEPITDRQAAFAAAQLAAVAGGGLLNAGVTRAVGAIPGAMRMAPVVGAGVEGAAVGGAYDEEDPTRGALAGSVLGMAANVLPRLKLRRPGVEPLPAERQLTGGDTKRKVEVRVVDEPTSATAHEPDYTVEDPYTDLVQPSQKPRAPTPEPVKGFKLPGDEHGVPAAPKLEDVETSLATLKQEHATAPDELTRGELTSRVNMLEAQRRKLKGEPEPEMAGAEDVRRAQAAGVRNVKDIPEPVVQAAPQAPSAGSDVVQPAAQPAKHEFSSTQLDLPPEASRGITALAAKIPDADLAKDGRETEPHITVKYGLHGNEPEKVRALLADEKPVTVTLGKTSVFPDSGSGDVVKVDVDSPELHALNKKIADALPHTDTHPEYQPHATVAYVKPGLGKKYEGDASLAGQQITLHSLTFSGQDGKKVEIPLGGAKPRVAGQPGEPERIVAPSVVLPDGTTASGTTHLEAWEKLRFPAGVNADEAEKFLTSSGRHVTRQEAEQIALASGQLKPDTYEQQGEGVVTEDIPELKQKKRNATAPVATPESVSSQQKVDAKAPWPVVGPPQVGGPSRVFHGSSTAFEEFDGSHSDPNALYGPGFYFTENPRIASGYAEKKGRGGAPNVRTARLDIKRPFDADDEFAFDSKDVQGILAAAETTRPDVDWDYGRELLEQREETHNLAGTDIYKVLSKMVDEHGVEAKRAAANAILRAAGYDGITHVGGESRGDPHRVWVAFDRSQIHEGVGGVEEKPPAKKLTRPGAEKPAAQKPTRPKPDKPARYAHVPSGDLLEELATQQAKVDDADTRFAQGHWVRTPADGSPPVSGGSLSSGMAKKHRAYALQRIDEIEQQLRAQGIHDEDIQAARFDAAHAKELAEHHRARAGDETGLAPDATDFDPATLAGEAQPSHIAAHAGRDATTRAETGPDGGRSTAVARRGEARPAADDAAGAGGRAVATAGDAADGGTRPAVVDRPPHPDADAGSARQLDRDLFGNAPERSAADQGALFGEKAGTEAARNLQQTEESARAELAHLKERLAIFDRSANLEHAERRGQTAKADRLSDARAGVLRRIAELEQLVTRDQKIGAASSNPYEAGVEGWWTKMPVAERKKSILYHNAIYPARQLSLGAAEIERYQQMPPALRDWVGIEYARSVAGDKPAHTQTGILGGETTKVSRATSRALHQLDAIDADVRDIGGAVEEKHAEARAALDEVAALLSKETPAPPAEAPSGPRLVTDEPTRSTAKPDGGAKRRPVSHEEPVADLFSPAAPGTPLGARTAGAQGTPPNPAQAKRVKSLAEIARTLSELVDVPLRQGRFLAGARRAAGVFFTKSEVARVLRFDRLGTVTHEIGHFISQEYLRNPTRKGAAARGASPLTPTMARELVKMGKDLYGSRKPNGGYGEEGIAQWAKFYVTEPARLQTDAPTFSKWAEQTVLHDEPALKAALDQARADFADYQKAPATARIDAMIDVKPSRRFLPNPRTLATAMIDDLAEIRRAVEELGGSASPAKDAYVLARLSRGGAGMAEEMILRGIIDPATGKRVTKGIAEVLKQLKRADVQPFRRYLAAERTLEVAARGVDSGIAVADAQAVVTLYEAQFRPLAEELWKVSNALIDYRAAKGLLTPAEATEIKAKNQRRVGFYRVFDEDETAASRGVGKGFGRNSSGLQKMKGSSRKIIDPLESLITDVYRTVQQSHAAEVLSALVKHAEQTQGGGRVIEVLTETPKRALHIPVEQIQDQLAQLGFIVPNGNLTPVQGMVMAFEDMRQAGPGETKDLVRPLVIDGERKWIQINDAPLYNALGGLGTPVMPTWLRLMSIPTRTLRAGATLTLEFIGRNPVRDAWTAAIYSRAGTRPPLWDLGRGLFHVLKQDQLYEDWRLAGGDNAAMLGLDRVDVRKHVADLMRSRPKEAADWVLHPIDTLRMLSSLFENATRVGEFAGVKKNAVKGGATEADANTEAGLAARDVTIDFARAGTVGRQVNQLMAFFNANAQGWDKMGREFKERPGTVIPRILAFITLPSILLYLAQRDDPAYQEVPTWQKNLAWVIVDRDERGNVQHIWRIPKPPDLGILFGSVPERILDWVHTKDPHALDAIWDGLKTLNPIHLPEAIAPLVEWWANKSAFTGRPIVPEGLSKLPPAEQATSRTGEAARVVGRTLNASPAKIENTVKGYTGGLGDYGMDIGNLIVRQGRHVLGMPALPHPQQRQGDAMASAPLLKGFMVRVPQLDAQSVQNALDGFESAESHRQAWRRMLEAGDHAGARAYFRQHESAIRSVVARTDGMGGAGVLRQAHDLIIDAQRIARDADEETRAWAAEAAIRAARAALKGEQITRLDRRELKRDAARSKAQGHRLIRRGMRDTRTDSPTAP